MNDIPHTDSAPAVRYLNPSEVRLLQHGASVRLTLDGDRSYLDVAAARAFPMSDEAHYVSLRDGDKDEIGMIVEPSGLDAESRRVLDAALRRRYVIPVIQKVVSLKERFGTADWVVVTDRGERRFTTRHMRDGVQSPSPGRYMLSDVDGNRYDVRDLGALDKASQEMLMRHL